MTKKLHEFEQEYGDFYVPAFAVTVGTQDLVRDLFLTVTSVEVDLPLNAPGRFSFVIASAFDWKARAFLAKSTEEPIDLIDVFEFGSPIDVRFGYGSNLKLMLRGMVTEISTSFREGSMPELTVSGHDHLYLLVNGKNAFSKDSARDSDAVSDFARITGLSTDIRQTSPVKQHIEQGQESDICFVTELADRNRAIFYADGDRFYFGPRHNKVPPEPILELPLGQGLLTFNPEANLAHQVKTVEVHGRSAEKGEPIVGRASQGGETGRKRGRLSGAERIASAINPNPIMQVRAAVHTQAEADARARAIFEKRAEDFIKGDGESIGLPDIRPDMSILLSGLGKPFSKPYYVNAATHKVSEKGYRTSFNVQETTI